MLTHWLVHGASRFASFAPYYHIVLTATVLTPLLYWVLVYRHRTQLSGHQAMERLILKLSTSFINVPARQLDQKIQDALSTIGEATAFDQVFLFLFTPDKRYGSNRFEWNRDPAFSTKEVLKELEVAAFPWIMAQLEAGQSVYVPDVSAMPPEAAAEKELIAPLHIPLTTQDTLVGFFGFAYFHKPRPWTQRDISLLTIAGEMFGNLLARKTQYAQLEKLSLSVQQTADSVMITDKEGVIEYVNPAFEALTGFCISEAVGQKPVLLRSGSHDDGF